MALYKTHVAFNITLALPIISIGVYHFLDPNWKLGLTFIGAFVYSTLFMNPDLDVANRIKLFSLRGLFTLPFRGYAKLFKHRGISHSIFLGSLTRIAWLGILGLLLFYLPYQILPEKKDVFAFFHQYKYPIFYGLAGIGFADWSHILLDIFS